VNKFLIAAGIASAVLATPAFAQDTNNLAGPRVEALLGYDLVSFGGEDKGGVLFGIGAGYDFAVGNGVALGLDVEASDSTTDVGDLKAGRDLYAGGRVSFAVSPSANLYLKAGYTNARIKLEGCCSDNGDGFRLGVGGQLGIGGKAYVGGEYRYSNYESDFSRHQFAATIGTRF
jgi:outer membrane immunogenic protein